MDDQSLREVVAIAAGSLACLSLITIGLRERPVGRNAWLLAATAALAFGVLSLVAMWNEGLIGFWSEHVRSFWGAQIWVDLLLALVAAVGLLVPRARSMGMHPMRWIALVLCTGSIGLYCFLARLLYLESRSTRGA